MAGQQEGQEGAGVDLAARSPTSDVFGKLDDELPPIRINSELLYEVKRAATAAGYTLSEYVRLLLGVKVYGVDHLVSLTEARIRRATVNVAQNQDGAS